VSSTAAAAGTRRHTGAYPAEPAEVRVARAALADWLAGWLDGWPRADDAVLIASEFATNAVVHSASRHGGVFILRCAAARDRLRLEVEDAGGPWPMGPNDDGRPHGFDVVSALAGAGNWGIDGDASGRVAWAWLTSGGTLRIRAGRTVIRAAVSLPPPGDAARVSCFLAEHPRWSAWWDKKYGLWRVAEDDPDSDLYAESSDADAVIGYITAHA